MPVVSSLPVIMVKGVPAGTDSGQARCSDYIRVYFLLENITSPALLLMVMEEIMPLSLS